MIFDRHANLKYKYGSRNFGVEIIMLIQWDGKKVIADYIRNQLEEDYASDQISLKEYMDPFTGSERSGQKDSRT